MHRLLFFFIASLLFFSPAAAQHLHFRQYLTDQGIANATVFHILQDSNGFLWFATESGVIRFDGREFRQFTTDDGLSDNEVLKIFEDSRKRIWFLTLSGRLSYYANYRFYNERHDPGLKKANIRATFTHIYEDRHQNLWFSSLDHRFLKIGRNREVLELHYKELEWGRESPFYENEHQQLVLATIEGTFIVNKNHLKSIKRPYQLFQPRSFLDLKNGRAIFLAREGLVYQNRSTQKLMVPARFLPTSEEIGYLTLDHKNNLWVSTLGDGVYLFKDFFAGNSRSKHYLPGKIVTWPLQDQEGNMWFSTIGDGVYMAPANNLKATTLTRTEGLSENRVYVVTKDKQNQIWAGMDQGLVNVISPAGVRQIDIQHYQKKFRYNRVREILVAPNRDVWVGSDQGVIKLLRKPNGQFKKISFFREKNSNYPIKSLSLSGDGQRIFFATPQGMGQVPVRSRRDTLIRKIDLAPQTRTYTSFVDQAGSLWLANLDGLHQIKNNRIRSFGAANPLLAYRITDIAETTDRVLVVATYGYGVVLFKDGRILNQITRRQGLPENICKRLFLYKNDIWVATNKGLAKLTLKNKYELAKVDLLTVAEGLISNEINDIYVDDRELVIATNNGLNIIPVNNSKSAIIPPGIQITQVLADEKQVPISKPATLSPKQRRLIIEFTGISFQDPKNVQYQYQLDDNAWINTQNNFVELTSLSPGSHHFRVKAKKMTSNWSKPVQFSFYITPPYYRTWWFLSALVLISGLFILGLVRLYTAQKLRQQLRRLETERRLQQERERIARDLHDNVGSHLAYIINSLDEPTEKETGLAQNRANHLRDFTKQTISQLRETIWAIRQENLSVGEVGTKIHKLIWQVQHLRTNFNYEVNIQGNQEQNLSPALALNLFRIAQETINNVFKHSQATFLEVNFQVRGEKQLIMKIHDNGLGFTPAHALAADHYGLLNMRERAREIGARFRLSSEPGQGTTVEVEVSLNSRQQGVASPQD